MVWAFLAAELRTLQPTKEIEAVIAGMDLKAAGLEWPDAAYAADAAARAATYVADAAAAADAAAYGAATIRQRDLILKLMENAQ